MKVSAPPASITSTALHAAQTGTSPLQDVATTLVKDAGERKLTLSRHSNGKVDIELSRPPITQLVLSGGGAKGIAFPGLIQALEQKNLLAGLQVISGSSAGGISAALIASGMNAKDFDTLSDNIKLPELLNSKSAVGAWLQNASAETGEVVGKIPGKVGNISQLLLTLLPRLQTKAEPLEELLRSESSKSVLAHIAQMPTGKRPAEITAIADKLSTGSPTTFSDLDVLSQYIPAIKQLNITGTGMFGGRAQLVVFNASLTPDMDIARAAHISGALPVLFKRPVEQGMAFQESAEKTAFQDGGLLLNTPATDLYECKFAAHALKATEQLIVKFESEPPKKPLDRGSAGSALIDRFTGVAHTASHELTEAKLKALTEQTVTLPLKTERGDFRGKMNGTVNFTMPMKVKNHLQALTQQEVDEHLNIRSAVREHHQFDSIDDAVLAMDDEMIASVMASLQKDPASTGALRFRQDAQVALRSLDKAITEGNAAPSLKMTPNLGAALRNLNALATRPQEVEWLSRQLNDSSNRNFQQLLQAMSKEPTPVSKVLSSAIELMAKRDIAVIADNFTREVIYPSLFRPGQPDGNVALLRRAETNLANAQSINDFNRSLDDIADNYVARQKPWSAFVSATTVEMAKAWRMT